MAVQQTSSSGNSSKRYRRIGSEEAFAIPEQMAELRILAESTWHNLDLKLLRHSTNPAGPIYKNLVDLDEGRLRIMDENGVDMHVLSLTSPGVQCFDADKACAMASLANDRVAEAVARRPTRFAGLAAFAPQDPKRAVAEMERAVMKLKLHGFILNSHTDGEYMDDRKYWPILEAAEALDRAIYIHPRAPSELMGQPYADYGLYAALWGFQAEVSVHALRLMLSGVFDRFPKLKIVIGHMGESLPYNIWRMDYMYNVHKSWGEIPGKQKPSELLKRNFLITTSGVEHGPALKYAIEVLGADNILWAIDYPYQPTAPAVAFMNSVDITEEDKEKIFHKNAERVFHISPGN